MEDQGLVVALVRQLEVSSVGVDGVPGVRPEGHVGTVQHFALNDGLDPEVAEAARKEPASESSDYPREHSPNRDGPVAHCEGRQRQATGGLNLCSFTAKPMKAARYEALTTKCS